jgi:protein SCO1
MNPSTTQRSMKPSRSPRAVSPRLIGAIVVVFTALAVGAIAWGITERVTAPIAFFGTPYPDPDAAPAFELVNHHGAMESLASHQGTVVLVFFGFTHCPDVCPLTLSRLANTVERLGPRGDDVRILLITVDPERDSPDALAEYVARFGPSVTGLTGEPALLESIRRAYGVFAVPHVGHDGTEMTAHTDAVFGIDRAGLLRVLIRPDAPEHEMEADLRTLLRS